MSPPALPTTCRVALPLPAPQPYSYAVPPELLDRVVPGTRVVVPVRGRELVGLVTALGDEPPTDLKPVLLAPDPTPLVPEPLLAVAEWVARYYAAPLGLSLRAMLPGSLWGASRLVATAVNGGAAPGGASRAVMDALERAGGRAAAAQLGRTLKKPVWDVLQRLARAGAVTLETEAPDLGPAAGAERVMVLIKPLTSLLERDREFGRAARQRGAYDALDGLGGEAAWSHLVRQLGFSPAVLSALVERGLARVDQRERLRDPFAEAASQPAPAPNPVQREAITRLEGVPPGATALLYGVTGSGKTLAYLEAVRAAAAEGRGAIILVPEIGLTPQTVSRVRGVLGEHVAVLHSALSDGERADAWRAVAAGQRRVVVGARSAIFAPFRDLGAIVVDEEHDPSYKNGEAPRYHARQVAMARARLQGARVILASATPALETWAGRERLTLVRLPQRVEDRPLPPVRLVDLNTAERVPEAGAVPWSRALDGAVDARLTAGEQVLLLLNRRGLAHYLQCAGCGFVWECPHCSISLTVHLAPARLRCHYCGHDAPVPQLCGACGRAAQRTRGVGTQELERWLSTRFPAARIARMDADTTGTKWSHARILEAVERGDVDVLFGTQMIAKGLDFPNVTLVGVVDADTGLNLPDFRSAERTFQLIAQVAGRAGRGPRGGEVLVQTRSPRHEALQAAARHDYEGFAARETARRLSPAYPPSVGLVNVLVSGTHTDRVAEAAVETADWLRAAIAARARGVELLGPAPAPLARLKGRWRWHMVLRSPDRPLLGRLARYTARRAPHGRGGAVRLVVDRDPVTLL